jgi:hypothetical protein
MKTADPGIPAGADSPDSANRSVKSEKRPPKISGITPAISGVAGSNIVFDVVKIFWSEFYSLAKYCFRLIGRSRKNV